MRIGVLDIGSNTGHLLVVDAYRGAPPLPAYTYKEPLRLAEHLDEQGAVDERGRKALVRFVDEARVVAAEKGCSEVIAFATSAVRDAVNADDVLSLVERESGVALQVLPGEEEARLTFLAVRRWFGWSSGRLGVFDIGGGSLEIACGSDESPDVCTSLPLGAGRLTREWFPTGVPTDEQYEALRLAVRQRIAEQAGSLMRAGGFDHAVATSKTFRSLARLSGAAPSEQGPYVRRMLERDALAAVLEELRRMPVDEIAMQPGVSANRAHQMVAGAVVADAVMDLFDLGGLEVCPWALREGVLLERHDHM
ncbi:exopolyphosphatase/guanosine-5'-triphosphate,3'-diphosphate pyrophosphatase [Mumia flava]|uniref:Exopolyphosphatase/guanosine-5'-triphosphate, 3'-diphosphate pyrophosphatase n=1 Tax=Mumia flava TaxID=1348852 RepID=A0A0B2BQ55_9ACTN|nr:Ppx/GppA phosphatase family protein [Mumia flava]PJJ58157.1 exopolyphosphatase/guanosine-5'-triphosphate,3'-diphosphate pyrophosphatase [Mumia flava]